MNCFGFVTQIELALPANQITVVIRASDELTEVGNWVIILLKKKEIVFCVDHFTRHVMGRPFAHGNWHYTVTFKTIDKVYSWQVWGLFFLVLLLSLLRIYGNDSMT